MCFWKSEESKVLTAKRNVEKNKDTRPWELIYHEHRIFLELLERVGRNFIERK